MSIFEPDLVNRYVGRHYMPHLTSITTSGEIQHDVGRYLKFSIKTMAETA